MPNFPPGTGNLVNPGVTPTWAFTPNTYATNTIRVLNTGRNVVYVGGSQVTQNNGLPVLPGGRPLEITGFTGSLYALSGVGGLVIAGTMSSSAVTVGTT